MTTVTEDGGRENVYAIEPQMYYAPTTTMNHNQMAELLNGRLAMLGIMAALGSYALPGQMIPGIW